MDGFAHALAKGGLNLLPICPEQPLL